MSWSLKFDEPIAAPNHLKLRTLRDAGEYVTALPKADQAKPHWQTAAHELMMAAERGDDKGNQQLHESSAALVVLARPSHAIVGPDREPAHMAMLTKKWARRAGQLRTGSTDKVA